MPGPTSAKRSWLGNRRASVPVELRGFTLRGQVGDGEEVEASGTWRRGLLHAHRIQNETTGATVVAPHYSSALRRVSIGLVAAAIIGSVVFVAGHALGLFSSRSAPGRLSAGTAALVFVPDNLVGENQATAVRDLRAAGLHAEVVSVADPQVPAGTVIDVSPAIGQPVQPGSIVILHVATGLSVGSESPSLSPSGGASQPDTIAVLSVANLDWDTARTQLQHAGFRTHVQPQGDATTPLWQVIGTQPAAGTEVRTGTTVTIVVSAPSMPKDGVFKYDLGKARDALSSASITNVTCEGDPGEGVAGLVVATDPGIGDLIDPTKAVVLYVADGTPGVSGRVDAYRVSCDSLP